ncbi:MAG: hypothetical protein ACK51L_04165 [bacterium]|jgi:hypothetical protein
MCYKNQGKNRQFTAGAVLFAEVARGAIIRKRHHVQKHAIISKGVSDWLQEMSHMQKSNVSVTGHLLASETLCQ